MLVFNILHHPMKTAVESGFSMGFRNQKINTILSVSLIEKRFISNIKELLFI